MFCIGLELNFANSKEQITMYDVPPATSKPYQSGNWIGSTEQGGSCNFRTVQITPHCNGTHTESIGHIVNDKIFLPHVLKSPVFNSLLITIPCHLYETNDNFIAKENYLPLLENGDQLLLKLDLEKIIEPQFNGIKKNKIEGIIIRTLPNSEEKKIQNYHLNFAPFFSNDAMLYLTHLFKHIIVDLPSIDKAYDEGLLSNHHIFWNQPIKEYTLQPNAFIEKTITELVYIPDEITDGVYETIIGFPLWKEEAVPSSVWIKPIDF